MIILAILIFIEWFVMEYMRLNFVEPVEPPELIEWQKVIIVKV